MLGVFRTLLTYWRIPHLRTGLVWLVLSGVILFVVSVHVVKPLRIEFEAAKAKLVQASIATAELEQRISLAEQHRELTEKIARLDLKLNAAASGSSLVESFGRISSQAGTRIIHGANYVGTEQNGVRSLVQDLTVEGSYEQLRRFLAGTREKETLTLLTQLELGANADGTLVRGQMRFMTFSDRSE